MRTPSLLLFTIPALAAAIPTTHFDPRDTPISLVVSLWNSSTTCDTTTTSKAVHGNGCQGLTLSAGGSALVQASTADKYGYVTGYSGAGCTGDVVIVFKQSDECSSLDTEVRSWVSGAPFDEGGK